MRAARPERQLGLRCVCREWATGDHLQHQCSTHLTLQRVQAAIPQESTRLQTGLSYPHCEPVEGVVKTHSP